MIIGRKHIVGLACGLIVLCPMFMTGCTTNTLHPSCGGQYGATFFWVGDLIHHNVSQSDPHLTNWTKARITTTIYINAIKLLQVNHTYVNQTPGSGITTLHFNNTDHGKTVSYKLTKGVEATFTVTMAIVTDDPVISGTIIFNGTNSITGKMTVMDIGLDNHNVVSDIRLSKADPNVKVLEEKAPSVMLRSSDWSYDLMLHKNRSLTC